MVRVFDSLKGFSRWSWHEDSGRSQGHNWERGRPVRIEREARKSVNVKKNCITELVLEVEACWFALKN